MREYETIYVLKPDLPPEQISTIKEKIAGVITKGQGHVLAHSDWGKRKLAYDVNKFRHAFYIYFQYLTDGGLVSELERILKYDDTVLKFLTVQLNKQVNVKERLTEFPEAPEAPEEISSSRSFEPSGFRRGGFSEQQEAPRRSVPGRSVEKAPVSEAKSSPSQPVVAQKNSAENPPDQEPSKEE